MFCFRLGFLGQKFFLAEIISYTIAVRHRVIDMNTVIITYYLLNLTGFKLKSCFQKNHNFNQPHLNFRYTRLNYIVCKILYIYHSPMLDADCLVWLVILELVPEGIVISKCFNSQARMKDDANWMSRCRKEMESRINSPARKDAYSVVKRWSILFREFWERPWFPWLPFRKSNSGIIRSMNLSRPK